MITETMYIFNQKLFDNICGKHDKICFLAIYYCSYEEIFHPLQCYDTKIWKCLNHMKPEQHRNVKRGGRNCIRLGFFHGRSEEHTSELQSRENLVCRLLL